MRICFLLNDLGMGGTERQVSNLIGHWPDPGDSCSVLALGCDGPLRDLLSDRGISCRRMRLAYPWSHIYSPFYRIATRYALGRERPDVIMAYTNVPNVYGGMVMGGLGRRPLFVWNQRDAGLGRLPIKWEQSAIRKTSLFLANASSGADFLVNTYGLEPGHVHVVRNGIAIPEACDKRDQARRELGVDQKTLVACMLGNIRPPKDHLTLVRGWTQVCEKLARENRKAVLLFAGRKDDSQTLEAAIEQHGMDNSVRCLGYQQDIDRLLSGSDIAVFSSLSEGLPNGALEAAAAGLPVIANDIPAIRECLPGGQADLLFPTGDAASFAECVLRLAADPDLARSFGSRNRRYVADTFSIESMAQQTYGLVRQAVALSGETSKRTE